MPRSNEAFDLKDNCKCRQPNISEFTGIHEHVNSSQDIHIKLHNYISVYLYWMHIFGKTKYHNSLHLWI